MYQIYSSLSGGWLRAKRSRPCAIRKKDRIAGRSVPEAHSFHKRGRFNQRVFVSGSAAASHCTGKAGGCQRLLLWIREMEISQG